MLPGKRMIGLLAGLAAFAGIAFFLDLKPGSPEVTLTLAVAALMSVWWISEALPLGVTALVPLVAFPFLGIMNGGSVAAQYMNYIIFVYIGGFIMALAMERWNLHKRIALKIMTLIGIGPGRILIGFMLASAFLSMWISNTAATMMMIPIIVSVLGELETSVRSHSVSKYSIGVLLAVAYSSSVGGIATLVGTPTNLVYIRTLSLLYPDSPAVSFSDWLFFALPLSITMLIVIFLVIYLAYAPRKKWSYIDIQHFEKEYRSLGRVSREERIVLALLLCLALLWIFRSDIEIESFHIPGWSSLFRHPEYINDGSVAILIALLLFMIPARTAKGERIMDWKTARRLPWDVVLLFGGGFALAAAFNASGLTLWLGEQLSWASAYPPYIILIPVITLMVFLTELTSNVATSQMLLPVFAALAAGSGNNPILFMLPATLASSMAFMLPTATPPNAIVFGTHRVRIRHMVRTGLILNLISIVMIILFTVLLSGPVFKVHPGVQPFWAR